MSISPFGDLVAFAHETNLAIVKLKPAARRASPAASDVDSADSEVVLYGSTLSGLDGQEVITSILLIPLVSQQKTSGGSPDWTCVVVGFSSGYVRIYTETGRLLLSQQIHDEPVSGLKCQTFTASDHDSDHLDEITVVYKTVVVVIDGFSLYQTLRTFRQQLAKQQSGPNFGFNFGSDLSVPLTYKKWLLTHCEKLSDCENIGGISRSLYDDLVSQSVNRGPYGYPKPKRAYTNCVLTTGENPFVGFYYASDEPSHTILAEMTQAVINKVKNMIPLFGSKPSAQNEEKIEPANPLPMRLGLFDQNRDGISLSLSPDKKLLAVSDDYGRGISSFICKNNFNSQSIFLIRIFSI